MDYRPLTLELSSPFRIAHGASTERTNLLVRLGDGLGEGAMPPYYPHSYQDVAEYLSALDLERLTASPLALHDALDSLPPGPPPARAALDIALHDRWGKHLNQPLYRLWGLSPERAPCSAISLSIPEDEASYRAHLARYEHAPVLKLKLGSGSLDRDESLVRIARECTKARICIDVNGGWSLSEALEIISTLHPFGLLFIEQPIASTRPEDWRKLRSALPEGSPPLIADESIQSASDLLALAEAIDGVNIKLTKAGGLRAAHRQILLARTLGLRVLLGCMIESAIAVTAAAHLAPFADYADLDASLHLADDPYSGIRLDKGRIIFPEGDGLGVLERFPSA